MVKVRFNLGKGKNFMKWKIENNEGVFYLDPNKVNFVMTNAILKNRKTTAQGIKNGANKSVCAWILCDYLHVINEPKAPTPQKIKYNPRENPFWTNEKGENIDKTEHNILFTNNRHIYKL